MPWGRKDAKWSVREGVVMEVRDDGLGEGKWYALLHVNK